jgi:hypothetical protein
MKNVKKEKGEIVAKVHFWFGQKEPIFSNKYIVKYYDTFADIYKKKKLKEVV